jgi:erythromycin esterase-like protein
LIIGLFSKEITGIMVNKSFYSLQTAADLDPLMDRIGDATCVLLGEASHGTHEYYTWRATITKRLIKEKGFNFIAVEGDWPDCYHINRFIKGYEQQDLEAHEVLKAFTRWPTWMWANWEIASLVTWLKEHNLHTTSRKVGFYGLDVYSLWESMDVMVKYLEEHDPVAARTARQAMECFQPYGRDEQKYARAQFTLEDSCREPLIRLLAEIRKKAPSFDHDPEAALNTSQNAYVALNAEEYYSQMSGFNDNTWNLRDTHMMETLNRLLEFHGPGTKGIVWEHNTHIGDARFTDMRKEGMVNVGQLAREQIGEKEVVLVGFGSYQGTVIAADHWGAEMEVMPVPAARPGSIEEILHGASAENKLIVFDHENRSAFSKVLPHRAIGVVYNPQHERYGNYVPTVLSSRYDAFIYLDHTRAVHPLLLMPDLSMVPETYPFTF